MSQKESLTPQKVPAQGVVLCEGLGTFVVMLEALNVADWSSMLAF